MGLLYTFQWPSDLIFSKVKVKVPVIKPNAQRRSRSIALLFLDLGERSGG
jgi:hypothetical protein